MNPYTEAVSRGAALLDKERPGWRDEIDISMLDLSDACYCILGQVFEHYDNGLSALLAFDEESEDLSTVIAHGFTIALPFSARQWQALQEAWIAELRKQPVS